VSIERRHVQTLVEVWSRRDEPETADLQRALHNAEALEADRTSPVHLRAFAWHLTLDTHRAVQWDLPAEVQLSGCRSAAASLAHANTALMQEIADQIREVSGRVLVLGALTAGRSVFGRWDLLPARGALLVPLGPADTRLPPITDLPMGPGVVWAAPGRWRGLLERLSSVADLFGSEILMPAPELVAARVADRRLHPPDPETLLFCGAVLGAATAGSWHEVLRAAAVLGRGYAPVEAAVGLGLDRRLGLRIHPLQRMLLGLRRLLSGRKKTRA
jgi:hypothetical protein